MNVDQGLFFPFISGFERSQKYSVRGGQALRVYLIQPHHLSHEKNKAQEKAGTCSSSVNSRRARARNQHLVYSKKHILIIKPNNAGTRAG